MGALKAWLWTTPIGNRAGHIAGETGRHFNAYSSEFQGSIEHNRLVCWDDEDVVVASAKYPGVEVITVLDYIFDHTLGHAFMSLYRTELARARAAQTPQNKT
mgnify:CR=1 FL=1